MASNPLSVDSILSHMADALPTHVIDDTNSDISSSYEAIALFAHACMIAVGFRLLGFGEGDKNGSELQQIAPRLTSRWNASFGSHSFLYAHSQSSMQYVVKVDRLGGKAEIRGIGLGDERISRFEITAKDYVSPSALPLRIAMQADGEDRSSLVQKLKELFISTSRINDLATEFKLTIIQKLLPNLQKAGYEETPNEGSTVRDQVRDQREEDHARRNPREDHPRPDLMPQPARPHPFDDPLAPPPRGNLPEPMPGFDDEYDILRPRAYGHRFPFSPNIGHDDLNPPGLGPHDPLRNPNGGGGLSRPGGLGGGMHPTFDDPLFRGQGGQGGFDMVAPPGARYDPIGPNDPRDNGPRGRRQGDGMMRPGGPGGNFLGHPGGPPGNPYGGDFI